MRSGGAGESRLAYAVDLLVQLRADADRPEPELHRRDRALLPEGSGSIPQPQMLRRWLDQLRAAGYSLPGGTVATMFRVQLLVLFLGGIGIGWLVVTALFEYDGSRPVNVVHVLAGLVGVQLILLVLLGVVALPRRLSRWVPGLGLLQDVLGWLSPGQITRWLARRLPERLKGVHRDGGLGWGKDPWVTRMLKWAAMVSAQVFGVAFNLGALVAALYLVTFSDLAFSWSTTLNADFERGHRITSLLSAPWRGLWPEAVPSRTLIETTLYYRQVGSRAALDPIQWGGWWPFLVASLLVYGLAPRLILLGLGCWRLREAVTGAMAGAVGVEEVVDRLRTEVVSTRAVQAEEGVAENTAGGRIISLGMPAGRYWAVNWGGVEVSLDRLREYFSRYRGCEVIGLESAGGAAGLDGDALTIQKVADESGVKGVMVLVKSWEPPMLEFLDFMSELRTRMGGGRRLAVVMLGFGGEGEIGPPRAGDVTQWRRRLETLADDELTAMPWGEDS